MGDFDFKKLNARGYCSYAYVLAKGKLSVSHRCPIAVFINGENVYSDNSGIFSCCIDEESKLLIKCIKKGDEWDFCAKINGEQRNGLIPDYNRLWIEDEKLLSHIYFPHTNLPNRVPWGRGNGWMALTLTEIIRFLPDSYAKEKEEIKAFFKEFCEGILNALDTKRYIFHQVLNRHESYEETSCSCMFIIAFIRGFKYGLLDKKYADAAKRVWQTVTETSIDDLGNIYNVCMGSGCSMENEYYFNIPTKINDDHGTGIVLLAGSEILSL